MDVRELDHQESWALKNWCFQTVVLKNTHESPLDCKEIKPVNLKGNQPWIFTGRTDADAPIFWSPDAKSQFIRKTDAGKDWRQEEKGATDDEIVGGHHWLNGHEFEHTLGDSEGQGGLACCSPWVCKESDVTSQLDNNNQEMVVHTKVCKKTGVQWAVNEVYSGETVCIQVLRSPRRHGGASVKELG